MKTSEIRDKLLSERALYQQSVKDSDEAIKKIERNIAEITEDDMQLLLELGIQCREIVGFDLQRMKQDGDYLGECEKSLKSIVETLHSYLEAELGV